MKYSLIAATLLMLGMAAPVFAADAPPAAAAGSLKIENAFTRPTLGGATVAAGYLTITNTGKDEDRLLGITSDISARAEIHESKMQDGVMEMRGFPNGVAIPAGATVAFRPGSYHIMFIGLKKPVAPGDVVRAELDFAKAGKIAVSFPAAASAGATAPTTGGAKGMDDMKSMDGMKMR